MRGRLLVAAAALFVGACGATDDGGSDATESMVLETCAPGSVPVEEDVCRCAFDELRDRFDDEALERLDRQVRDEPDTIPPEVQEVVLACGFEVVAPPTTKPATTTTTATSSSTSSTTSSSSTSSTTVRPRPGSTSTTQLP